MARRNHQQLALAFAWDHMTLVQIPRAATRTRGEQTPIDRSTACTTVTAQVARRRRMSPRDSRGRFVSFPTIDAPSWYVFCADCYRIPGEPPSEAFDLDLDRRLDRVLVDR